MQKPKIIKNTSQLSKLENMSLQASLFLKSNFKVQKVRGYEAPGKGLAQLFQRPFKIYLWQILFFNPFKKNSKKTNLISKTYKI